MMCMEPISTMILRRCYKATVNESETITEHNGFVRFAAAAKPANSGPTAAGFRPCPTSNGAELGSVRKCRIALRAWPGDSARPLFPDPGPFLPVPHRAVRRGQDLAVEAAVPVAAADPRPGQSVRPRRLDAR